MKQIYSAPTINLKLFAHENIVTDSAITHAQVADIKSTMASQNGGNDVLTQIVSFKDWN